MTTGIKRLISIIVVMIFLTIILELRTKNLELKKENLALTIKNGKTATEYTGKLTKCLKEQLELLDFSLSCNESKINFFN